MAMLRLPPQIRRYILVMPDMVRRPSTTERALRPIAKIDNARGQIDKFQSLLSLPSS